MIFLEKFRAHEVGKLWQYSKFVNDVKQTFTNFWSEGLVQGVITNFTVRAITSIISGHGSSLYKAEVVNLFQVCYLARRKLFQAN